MKKYFILLFASALLLTATIGWSIWQRNSFSDESTAKEVSDNLSREISSLKSELQKIPKEWSKLDHSFYQIANGKFLRWSKNSPVLDVRECEGDFEWKLVQSAHSDLLLYKQKKDEQFFLIGVIPLRTGYDLVNQYLTTTWNKEIFPWDGIKILDVQSAIGKPVCTPNGVCLFKIQIEQDAFITSSVSVMLVISALICFLFFIFLLVRQFHRKEKYVYAFALLFILLAAIRIAMVQFSFPSRWLYSKYFDPKYFASSSFNASVGDFFLNALIVAIACAYFFYIYSRSTLVKRSIRLPLSYRWMIGIAFLTAAFFSFLFPHLFIEAIFHDSAIPIDITSNGAFDGVRIAATVAVCLGCFSSFLFVHCFVRMTKSLADGKRFLILLLAAALIFMTYFLYAGLNYWPTLIIGVLYILFLNFSWHYKAMARFNYRTFPFLMAAIIAYAIQGTIGIKRFVEEHKLRMMFRSATNMISNDVLGEYLLNQASQKISNDPLITATVESPLLSKNSARQKIRQVYLGDYFNRYEVNLRLYRADGTPADANSSLDFASSIESIKGEANKTNYELIYQVRSANASSLKHYVAIVPLKKDNSTHGYIAIDLLLKRIVPQQVYPELLTDNRFAQSIRNRDFSYAVYSKGKITDQNGNFNFVNDLDSSTLKNHKLYSRGIFFNNHWLVGAEGDPEISEGKQIVLAADGYSWFNVLANFSFLFTLGVTVVFLFLIYYLIRYLITKQTLNYSARIQLFVYLSFIFPLLAVSVIAQRMITQSNETQTEKEIASKGAAIGENLSDLLNVTNDSTKRAQDFKGRLTEISGTTGVDTNLYDADGNLISSSQTGIFSNQLLMPLLNREAWEKIAQENFSIVKLQSNIGLLDYNSSYFAIRSTDNDELLGILELPFFNSPEESLKSNVLANILITFTVVFILFSFFASNAIDKLTSPLQFIAKKLNTTSLANNQPIEWGANDEIGTMVKEYNRMLQNLDQSKTELARSEKEMAWREIAKQVAHEIKNPLTPMKLTLQQMERNLVQGELSKERTENSVQMLLSQVETLNGIAGSFSAFAAMPSPVLAQVELNSVLQKTTSLFESHSLGKVLFEKPIESYFVLADEQMLGRIFSNIILNGLQSNKENPVIVEVTVHQEKEWCIVSFKDNGLGVSDELKDKIFLPHFSTKETGSGLGLAIAKQGIEQMGGSIWFETTVGAGTSFFIRLKNQKPEA